MDGICVHLERNSLTQKRSIGVIFLTKPLGSKVLKKASSVTLMQEVNPLGGL